MIFVGGPYHGRDVLVADDQQAYTHLPSATLYHRQKPYLTAEDGDRWHHEVMVHQSVLDAADAAQAMEALKDAVLRWWITNTGEHVAQTPVEKFYIGRCETCELDMPFSDEVKRARWASGHNETTGHRITLREEPKQP